MKEFIKIESSFWWSTISKETADTRILFQAMIQLADKDGIVLGSPAVLAKFATLDELDVVAGLDRLMSPDPDSTSPKYEGRRVLELDKNVWRVVNYKKYIKPASERSAYQRELMRKRRAEEQKSTKPGAKVSQRREEKRRGDESKKKTTNPRLPGLKKQKQFDYPDDFEEFWKLYPRKPEKMAAYVEWQNTEEVRPPQKELLAIIADQARQWRNQGTEPGKIIYARRWLERRRWET